MNGNYLLDTNICIDYINNPQHQQKLLDGIYAVSLITEIELLSRKSLESKEETSIRDFLSGIEIVGIDKEIKNTTISMRKKHGMKTPDAIILGTALAKDYFLLTEDLKLRGVFEKSFE